MSDEMAVITHHEAGHAVATLMTVDNEVGDQSTVTVAVVDERGTGNGNLLVSGDHPIQAAFIFYAGPWAEARVQWSTPVHTLDDTNDDGKSFRETVKAAFDDAADFDGGSDSAYYAALADADPSIPDNEPYWSCELERAWPVIDQLAHALRDGLNNAVPDTESLAALGHTIRTASMPGPEVVALVQPLLVELGMWHYLA
jgi:hypothetical protein